MQDKGLLHQLASAVASHGNTVLQPSDTSENNCGKYAHRSADRIENDRADNQKKIDPQITYETIYHRQQNWKISVLFRIPKVINHVIYKSGGVLKVNFRPLSSLITFLHWLAWASLQFGFGIHPRSISVLFNWPCFCLNSAFPSYSFSTAIILCSIQHEVKIESMYCIWYRGEDR